ncbi:MAG: hypothetical protein NT124_04245 [Candidatus Dependentiae bacterium]|nr:hypothetical protein [Candidatus Dependentiae bacterium]
MKKKIVIAALGLAISNGTLQANPHQIYARSFMAPRPVYEHLSTQQSLWHDIVYNKTGPIKGAFRAIGFAQQSIAMDKTAHYFLPPCTQWVHVAGDSESIPEPIRCARNIRAEWLGLSDDFVGSFTITPKEKQYGFSVEYNQNLSTFFDLDLLKSYWVSIAIPFVAAYRSLQLQQHLINAPKPIRSGQPADIYEAFQQPSWCYAKIGCETKSVRPAEIRLTIGSSLVSEDYFQFAYNTIFIAPTGNKQNGHELFQAIAGNNQHFAFGGAIFSQFPLNRNTDCYGFCFFANLETIFNIRNTQHRTLDLRGKPWSRYMLFNQKCGFPNMLQGQQHIPGVNVLTHKVVVRPYGVFDFSTGWRLSTPTIEGEIGYNVWGRSNERVLLKTPWNHLCEYQGIYGIAGTGPNTTASESTIAQQAPNDLDANGFETFTPIDLYDIEPQSAESGSVINQKIHVSLGTRHESKNITSFIGGGTYIDIPQKNTSLLAWGAWFTCGASF